MDALPAPYITPHFNLSLGRPDEQVLMSTPNSSSTSSEPLVLSPNIVCAETSDRAIEETVPICSEETNVESGNICFVQF